LPEIQVAMQHNNQLFSKTSTFFRETMLLWWGKWVLYFTR